MSTKDNPQTESEVSFNDAKYWQREIELSKARNKTWYTQAAQARERFTDEPGSGETKDAFGKLNILSANVETQRSALGEDFGDPSVTRINADKSKTLPRIVSELLERTIDASVKETMDNTEIRAAVVEMLIEGKGQVWLELDERDDISEGWKESAIAHVHYMDYLEGAARSWRSMPWVARGHMFSKDDLEALKKEGGGSWDVDSVPLTHKVEGFKDDHGWDNEAEESQFGRARVWEIWTKAPEKARIYIAEDFDKVLKVDVDPFRLKRFFPCPEPIYAQGTFNAPLTDYSRYRDQALELDRISSRIYVLTDTLRRRGVVDAKFKKLEDLAGSADNVFIPVDNYDEFIQKGGLTAAYQVEDLQPTIIVLAELHQQRRTLIETIYELSGISDLARGATDPDETAKAQSLKATFGSSRFKSREKASRRFAAQAYELKGELIAEWCEKEQFESMSGMSIPYEDERNEARQNTQDLQQLDPALAPDPIIIEEMECKAKAPATWEQVSAVLKSDQRRTYMVDIETDQTQFMDQEADKKARMEYLSVVNELMQQFGPQIAGNPANGEVFKEIIMFALSGFKAGRPVEESIERAVDNAIQQAMNAPQGDPAQAAEAQKMQIEMQLKQMDLQIKQMDAQTKAQQSEADRLKMLFEIEMKKIEVMLSGQKLEIDVKKHEFDTQAKMRDTALKQFEHDQKIRADAADNENKAMSNLIDMEDKINTFTFNREQEATAREQILKDNDATNNKEA